MERVEWYNVLNDITDRQYVCRVARGNEFQVVKRGDESEPYVRIRNGKGEEYEFTRLDLEFLGVEFFRESVVG